MDKKSTIKIIAISVSAATLAAALIIYASLSSIPTDIQSPAPAVETTATNTVQKSVSSSQLRLEKILGNPVSSLNLVNRSIAVRLPESLNTESDSMKKKSIFAKSLLPNILLSNEALVQDRIRLLAIIDDISIGDWIKQRDIDWLHKQAKRYRVPMPKAQNRPHAFIPNTVRIAQYSEGTSPVPSMNQDSYASLANTLLNNIDIIPPSLALAQAAMESGWGTSYFAQEGNALFGEWVWGDGDGILPRAREEGKTHKIKKFDSLADSVKSYMLNLNRHRSYAELRVRRAELRRHNLPITGRSLAPALIDYSERGTDYVNDILSIISYNGLEGLDMTRLTPSNTSR